MTIQRAVVDHIPLLWVEPVSTVSDAISKRPLVIWLHGFGGTKESSEDQLRDLAAAGFVALSYDAWQHGERRMETPEELGARVVGNIRRHFWPILSQTAEEVLRIIDWAEARLGVASNVGIGGISMGGDIAIAAAGIDSRISTVAACIATPDWLRPGSFEPPGEADAYAELCYARHNPLTNLHHYGRGPALSFQCGMHDAQVPPDGAQRFVSAQKQAHPIYQRDPQRLEVVLQPETGHGFTAAMWNNSLRWFSLWLASDAKKALS